MARKNHALASNGATIVASSTLNEPPYSGEAAFAIDGDDLFAGSAWNGAGSTGGIWHSLGAPANIVVTFPGSRNIDEIDVITVRDSFNDKSALTLSEIFTQYGVIDFTVEKWNGTTWVPFITVTGNNKVWRKFSVSNGDFTAFSTTKIKFNCTNAANTHTRLMEFKATGEDSGGNTAPTISNITDATTVTTTPINKNFTIGDAETSAGSLTVAAGSSDQLLIPNANLILGGSGANRTLQITAAAGQTGTAQITVAVSDGVNTTTDTFNVTVIAAAVGNAIKITFDEMENADGYKVKRAINSGFTNGVVEEDVSDINNYFFTNPVSGQTYWFKALAYNIVGGAEQTEGYGSAVSITFP